jgi:hypothetical protein
MNPLPFDWIVATLRDLFEQNISDFYGLTGPSKLMRNKQQLVGTKLKESSIKHMLHFAKVSSIYLETFQSSLLALLCSQHCEACFVTKSLRFEVACIQAAAKTEMQTVSIKPGFPSRQFSCIWGKRSPYGLLSLANLFQSQLHASPKQLLELRHKFWTAN